MGEFRLLKGSWDLVDYNWSYKSPNWAYPSYNLLITLLTKSHDPLSNPTLTPNNLHFVETCIENSYVGAPKKVGYLRYRPPLHNKGTLFPSVRF